MRVRIRKGLSIPIKGKPEQRITDANDVSTVAVTATCINNLRPKMAVAVGDHVRIGQTLFADKGNPEIHFTSPGAGEVIAINRGARRALQSVVVQLHGDDAEQFTAYSPTELSTLSSQDVRRQLLQSGLWTTLRTRPFSHIPDPDTSPDAIFVTAIDSNPLAADPAVIIAAAGPAFEQGLEVIARLADVKVYVCTAADSEIACPETQQYQHVEFQGPHPAGLVGTHIHHVHPVSAASTVWYLSYHHVIAIGRLFTTGRLAVEKIISLGGPMVLQPRLLRTRIGANTAELLQNETAKGQLRIISGSVLSGHQASGPLAYIGRYHNQISVIEDGSVREFLAWLRPGFGRYSATRAYAAHVLGRDYALTTSQNGSPRAMVSIGSFEKVMPLDILPTPLLKALLVQDTDRARELGCLELDEEDLALCSFVCNGKHDYGPYLRANLDEIEANG